MEILKFGSTAFPTTSQFMKQIDANVIACCQGLFCKKHFTVRQIPDDLLLDISPKNLRFSTRICFPMIF